MENLGSPCLHISINGDPPFIAKIEIVDNHSEYTKQCPEYQGQTTMEAGGDLSGSLVRNIVSDRVPLREQTSIGSQEVSVLDLELYLIRLSDEASFNRRVEPFEN
ncbi:hypothetical protein ACOSQ3_029299 [Xanthoceras sorbifolium]